MMGINKKNIYCPTCKKAGTWTKENIFRPFCSDRCKLIDLGEWASDTYRIPDEKDKNSPPTSAESDNES
jgi:hypothetical protein